jgi:hypothetical protein
MLGFPRTGRSEFYIRDVFHRRAARVDPTYPTHLRRDHPKEGLRWGTSLRHFSGALLRGPFGSGASGDHTTKRSCDTHAIDTESGLNAPFEYRPIKGMFSLGSIHLPGARQVYYVVAVQERCRALRARIPRTVIHPEMSPNTRPSKSRGHLRRHNLGPLLHVIGRQQGIFAGIFSLPSQKTEWDVGAPDVQRVRCGGFSRERRSLVDEITVGVVLDNVSSSIEPRQITPNQRGTGQKCPRLTSSQKPGSLADDGRRPTNWSSLFREANRVREAVCRNRSPRNLNGGSGLVSRRGPQR